MLIVSHNIENPLFSCLKCQCFEAEHMTKDDMLLYENLLFIWKK